MRDYYRVRFDTDAILKHFGGINGAVEALKSVGMTVKPKTLEKQRERDNMPADMVASLALAAIRTGKPLLLSQFLLEQVDGNQEG